MRPTLLDWQFAMVTLIALGALGVLVRRFAPARRRPARRRADPGLRPLRVERSRIAPRATPRRARRPRRSCRCSDLRETARK